MINMNNVNMKVQKLAAMVILSVALMVLELYGAPLGKLRITVLDSKEKPVAGVKISIFDTVDNSMVFTVTTDKMGIAVQVGLQNHTVRVTLEKEGYRTIVKNIKIPVGLLVEERLTMATVEEGLLQQEAGDPAAQAVHAFNQAASFIKAKKYDEASEALKKSIALDGKVYLAHYYLGVIYFEQGKFQESVEPLLKVIELNPEYGPVYRLLAAVYEKLNDPAQAAKYATLARDKGGKTAADAYNDGVAAFNAGDMNKAILAFNEALKLDDKFAPAYFQLGLSFVNTGDNEKALAALKKYLELKPDGEDADTARSIIEGFKGL